MVFINEKKIPNNFKLKTKIKATNYLLNGKFVEWKKDFYDVYSPIYVLDNNGKEKQYKIGSYPLMDSTTALKILDSAYNSYKLGMGVWPTYSIEERLSCFEKFILKFKELKEEIVNLLMWEIGKNYSDSVKEFDRTLAYIEESIEEIKEKAVFSNDFILEENVVGQIKRSPLGVVLCMGPYNYPLNESFTTLIPALLMGNVVLFKPPKRGVLLHYPIIEAFASSFPKGVFNIIYGAGEEVIKPIMQSGKVSVLAFIGSSKAANIIQKYHPKPNRLKLVLGLEAKNVAIVLNDADVDNAVNECLLGSLSFNGQRCTALKLLYVHKNISKEFISKFVKKVEELKMGLPFDNTFLTPVHIENIKFYNELVLDAKEKGAKILNKSAKDNLSIFYPKVLFPVTKDMRVFNEEQFGPIVPIVTFSNINEPIDYIVDSNYGQQCSIFSRDSMILGKMIDLLINQVSRINLNSQCQRGPDSFPFTGRKDSAVGTLSISDALKVFSIRTVVSAKLTNENKKLYKDIIEKNQSSFLKKEILF